MAVQTIEERLTALEAVVERLTSDVYGKRPGIVGRTHSDFLDTMVGIHADSPMFAQMSREIEAERERERAEARRLEAEDHEER